MSVRDLVMAAAGSGQLGSYRESLIKASDAAASDNFGASVALSADGNTLAVGAHLDDNVSGTNAGSVYVFVRSNDSWTEQVRLQASDAAANDQFGFAVSISADGNTLAVGAYFDNSARGSVYVFTRSGTTWAQQARLQTSDGLSGDRFGTSVALSSDGNTLAAGSIYADNSSLTDFGAVYVFVRSDTTWTQQAKVQASDATSGETFGSAVALSADGNMLAVGCPYDNDGGASAGSAYVFTRSGATWSQQVKLQASDVAAGDNFGISVSLSASGNTLAVGSAYDDNSGGSDAGSVYVFVRSGTTWTEQTRLQASDAALANRFGNSVSLSADGRTMAVGAHNKSPGGYVYVYMQIGVTWLEQTRLQASNPVANDRFGYSVALSADSNTVAVGAYVNDGGSVYTYTAVVPNPAEITWLEQRKLTASDAVMADIFGWSVAVSSDGNTLAASAIYDDNSGGTNAGSVYVFTRSGTTWTQEARIQAVDAAAYDYFGTSVALSANGNTLAVGAQGEDNLGGVDAGSAYVFVRSGTSWSQQAKVQPADSAASDNFGIRVALSDDGNTLAVGSNQDDNSGGTNAGSAYVFVRSGTTWAQQARLQASDAAAGDNFGFSIALSADGNTLATGAYLDDNSGGADAGSVYVFIRSGTTWAEQAKLQASDAAAGDSFGSSVALSADGSTLAVGSVYDDNAGGTNAGSAYVFTRSGLAWTEQSRLQASDPAANDEFSATSVSLSDNGNVLAVGSYKDDTPLGVTDGGGCYVFVRSGSAWTQQARLQASNPQAADAFGNSVALSADGNTLAVGAYLDTTSATQTGSVSVFTTTVPQES